MAFAAKLNKVVAQKQKQVEGRGEVGLKWNAYESKLLDQAVELFRLRCQREASQRRCLLTASFEVLSREIPGFPSHTVKDHTYVVNSWGKEKLAEAWYYATHGTTAQWSPGAPVLFAEMLEGMMPKFLERLLPLGFKTCQREAGTWKVRVEWTHPASVEEEEDEEGTEEVDEDEEKENEEKAKEENEEKKEEEKEKKEDDEKVEVVEEKKEDVDLEKEEKVVDLDEDKENEEKTENGDNGDKAEKKEENGDGEDKVKEKKVAEEAKKKEKKVKKKKAKKVADNFAATLTQMVQDMMEENKEKEAVASKWTAYESKLTDQAVDLFKQRCTKEAEGQRLEVCVSFEVLSREITDFPKRVVKESNYFVESWVPGVTAESWFFATHGTNAHFNAGDPVLFAEVLECMMPKFVEKLGGLGFLTCGREPGTWKVSVTWADPDGEPAPKKRKVPNGHH